MSCFWFFGLVELFNELIAEGFALGGRGISHSIILHSPQNPSESTVG
jgi:hypothetical protein